MLNISKWNLFFVFSVCLLGFYYILPNFYGKSEVTALPKFLSQKQVNLGLDLQGGSHLLLEVDTKSVLKDKSEDLVDDIRKSLRKSKANLNLLETVNVNFLEYQDLDMLTPLADLNRNKIMQKAIKYNSMVHKNQPLLLMIKKR